MEKVNDLVAALYPQYGTPGSRDIDVTERRKAIDESAASIAEAFRVLERTSDTNMAAAQAMRDDMYHWKQRAEAAEAKLAQRSELNEEAMHCATILEFIGSFKSDDIDGDFIDLRIEIDGEDTGSDVSITEYALRSAKAIRAIISGASVLRPAPAINLAELVPGGWKLVPVEPTKEMRLASRRYVARTKLTSGPGFYRAMVAAAPTPNE